MTSLPSGPLVLPVTLPAPAAPAPPVPDGEPSLEELLAQYGHLLEPLMAEAVPVSAPAVDRVPEPVLAQDAPTAHPAEAAAPVQVAAEPAPPVATAPPLPVATVPTPVEPDLDALAWLSEALAQEAAPDAVPAAVAAQAAPPFVPAQATGPGEVQLGFRDGSTASLGAEESRALHDLARSLTSSD